MSATFILFATTLVKAQSATSMESDKHRLVILADMGNEPDEEQQMAHLFMYANEFDLEGLISVSGKFLHAEHRLPERRRLYPELFEKLIDGYEKVYENLVRHAGSYPKPEYLRSIVAPGHIRYGVQAVEKGKGNPGSELLIRSFKTKDDRPLYIVVNAGSNTLAQALIDYEDTVSPDEMLSLLQRLWIFENGAQDDAGAWICARYPKINWLRSNYQTYAYGGPAWGWGDSDDTHSGPYTWQPYEYSAIGQHQWALEHIKNHGALGAAYPMRQTHTGKLVFIEGGGTIPWLGLIHRGLSDFTKPHWGGWSGRFSDKKQKNIYSRHESVKATEVGYGDFEVYTEASDRWVDAANDSVYDNDFAPIWRWRQAYFDDFKARMDWCVSTYEEANHHPVAAINGDSSEKIYHISAKAGKSLSLDASASKDPDGDTLKYNWWTYGEPSSYKGEMPSTENLDSDKITVQIPEDATGKTIHIILELSDGHPKAPLTDYRRIVVEVE